MPEIADINDTELWTARATSRERYSEDRELELQISDRKTRLTPSDREPSPCPVLYRTKGGSHFVVLKAGDRKTRSQFYYKPYHQFSTGRREYYDLDESVIATLQAQEAGEINKTRR